jgi:hypothetical protein
MDLNIGLYLTVYWNTDETTELVMLDKTFTRDMYTTRKVLFYSIDNVIPISDEIGEYSTLYSGGTSFITPYTVEEIRKMISKTVFQVQNN